MISIEEVWQRRDDTLYCKTPDFFILFFFLQERGEEKQQTET